MSAPRDPLDDLYPEPPSFEEAVADWLPAFIARAVERDAQHRATCTAPICRACDRPGCVACGSVVVTSDDETCVACRTRDAVAAMRIPRRYADALENLAARVRNPRARQLAVESLRARAVVARGCAGSGKSTAVTAKAILRTRRAIEAGRLPARILFVSAIDLGLARFQHRLGAGEAELVTDATNADVLILDDLGAEGAREVEVIATVLHARHNSDLATWITTGLGPAEIGARYGGGVERRVYEGAFVIDCDGGPTR